MAGCGERSPENSTDLADADESDAQGRGRIHHLHDVTCGPTRPTSYAALVPNSPTTLPLRQAWHEALYGADGFYRQPGGPAAHFSTSAQGLPGVDELLAECIIAIAEEHRLDHVVEIGCGRGELLALIAQRSQRLQLTGVDVVDRPAGLPASVEWVRSPGGESLPDELTDLRSTLVLAHEWLDVVPCEIAVTTCDGLRVLEVAPDGGSRPGRELSDREREWCEQHWPDPQAAEIGTTRDDAYRELRSRIADGLLICVDYGHTIEDRPTDSTFTGYRAGAICEPRFDGSTDLTAHVSMDSLGVPELLQQKDIAARYLVIPDRPDHELARMDPTKYLLMLRRRSAYATFTEPAGLGAFYWSLERVTSSDATS